MDIQEIKARLQIEEVLAHYGYQADANGRLCCPFHEDKTPSLQVYKDSGKVYCFSSNCKTHGKALDVIDFIELQEQCSKHEAIMKAKELLGVSIIPQKIDRIKILESLYPHFQKAYLASEEAQNYLASRALKQAYAYQDSQFYKGHLEEQIKQYVQLGLLYPSRSWYKSFASGCLLFPLKDAKNQIVSLYGRSIKSNTKSKHFYLKHRRGLYPSYPKPSTKKLILVESILDAASVEENREVFSEDVEVLALYGVNGLSAEHQAAIKAISDLEEVILFMDGDEAGAAAVKKLSVQLRALLGSRVSLSQLNTPTGEDPNSLLVSHSKEIYGHLLSERTFLFSRETQESSSDEKENIITYQHHTPELDTSHKHTWHYESPQAIYSIKGGIKGDFDSLKVSLEIFRPSNEDHKSRLKLDLFEDRQSEKAASEIAEKLALRTDLVLQDLSTLTNLLEAYRKEEYQKQIEMKNPKKKELSPALRQKCLRLLRKVDLLRQINTLIGKSGVVGEEQNRLFLYLIASSYKQPKPLNALIQGSSGSGKTHLLQQISKLMPKEDKIHFTRVTSGSLYNYGEWDLSGKLLCFEDLDGLQEEALLALRELLSNGLLYNSTTITQQNGRPQSGNFVIRGPVATLSATTKGWLYEDNMSRSFVVAVDESATQTQKILDYQNAVSAGRINKMEQEQAVQLLQGVMSCLQPCEVINPYAGKVLLPENVHKIRRLNELYQCYVRQITWLHQYQREKDAKGRLMSTKEDLQAACELMFESIVLKADELDGSLRQFYERLKDYLTLEGGETYEGLHFGQREIRQALGVSKSQAHRYFTELQELEYIHQVGGYANRGFQYKILYWDNHALHREELKDYLEEQLEALEEVVI
ncbi:MAG: CHC2 zinc finger domain-containing protein [Bacteroidota bacterium]